MKKLTKSSLEELAQVMPVLSEQEQSLYVGGDRVEVLMTRTGFGVDATTSNFVATAYDDDGNIISSITGVMLEPVFHSGEADVTGSGTAIAEGTYDIVKSSFHGKSGYYGLQGVPGRNGIMIHEGNTSDDTEGCLLPGETLTQVDGKPFVTNSKKTKNELFDMFEKYGGDGITMTIGAKKE